MYTGTIRVSRELEAAVVTIASAQTGILSAEVVDEDMVTVTIEYRYPVAMMKMFIAHELHRKIELLKHGSRST